MSEFLQRAESILETASAAPSGSDDTAIIIDRAGAMRIVNLQGWSLMGLIQEFGAAEVYKIERRSGKVQVDGWSPSQQCLLTQKDRRASRPAAYPSTLQLLPQLAA